MRTLCVDVGGTGIKGTVYDVAGVALCERQRLPTPRPATPDPVLETVAAIAAKAGEYDRVAVGFPGVVEEGITKTAPNLDGIWGGFDVRIELERRLGKPVRIANDADVHGLAVVEGRGVEMVLTLGTGLGSGIYVDGRCAWNLELGHHTYNGRESYEDRVSDRARKSIGNKKWRKRVVSILEKLDPIFNYRKLYLGGGNAARLDPAEMPPNVAIVDNAAGMLGGLKLWT